MTTAATVRGFELRELISEGVVGAVYRAYQAATGREVAIKVILPGRANQADFIRRFAGEAQLIARLEHPHILPLYDYWRDPEGAYLVMRWLRGGSLREAMHAGAFSLNAAALLLEQIAGALAVAHRNTVIHRDIKPGNILLDEDGNAYLTDFGIATDLHHPTNSMLPETTTGSLAYVSPEQACGAPVTARTDMYSLGVTLYEIVTGSHPFADRSPVETVFNRMDDPLPEITGLGSPSMARAITGAIQRATARDPQQRYADPLAFAADFRAAIGIDQTPVSIVERLTPREHDILHLITEGLSNREIAQQLTVTLSTVKWYINQIYNKLGVRSRVQAMVRARELHLLVQTQTHVPATSTHETRPANPYKGLRAFETADNQRFFGRERAIARLVDRMGESAEYGRFLSVVGPSGSGKSSLVKAGLIPALWRGDLTGSEKWFIVEMLPGARPLDALEIALGKVAADQSRSLCEHLKRDADGFMRAAELILPNDGSDLLLVIDQFEELFTLVSDEAARRHFLDLLVAAIVTPGSRIRVIVTLRADFYDRPLQYPAFAQLLSHRLETVLPLSADELARAIAGPAEHAGVHFEAGLIASLVAEVHDQPGALPLLQYALTELFERRHGRLLTHAAYAELGGAGGALARRAGEIYAELTPAMQRVARQMFLRLVRLGEAADDTRQRVLRSELLSLSDDRDSVDEVIDTLANYRLLSLDTDAETRSPTVELAHEAMLREWKLLRQWVSENRDEIRMQQQLTHLTEDWLSVGRDASYLVTGTRLERFETWANDTQWTLTPDERAYLEASIARRAHAVADQRERLRREITLQRRSQIVLRALVAVLLLATVGALGLTGVAVTQAAIAQRERDSAQVERERAEQQARIAQARELVGAADSALETDAELSTLLALQAVNTTYAVDGSVLPESETMLHQAVQRLNSPLRLPAAPYGWFIYGNLSMTADGTRIVYMTESAYDGRPGETAVTNVATGEVRHTISGELVVVRSLTDRVTTWLEADNGSVVLQHWDLASEQTPQLIRRVTPALSRSELDRIEWLDFSPDFQYMAIYDLAGVNRQFDLISMEEISDRVNLPPGKGFVQFSPDNQWMAYITAEGSLSLLETGTWLEIARLSSPGTRATYFEFSPLGTSLIVANANSTVSVWETGSFSELYTVSPGIRVQRLALSPDGALLGAASVSGRVVVWNTVTQQEQLNLRLGGSVAEIIFDTDGTRLISYHTSGHVQITNLVPGREHLVMMNDPILDNGPAGLAYSPDGGRLVVGSMSATPTVWNARTGERIFGLSAHSSRVLSAAWSHDGATIATAGDDATVILWDAATGEPRRILSGHSDSIYGLAFSPDNRRVASSSSDRTVRIWDVATGEALLTLDQPAWSKGIAFSPDGTRLAAGVDKVGSVGYLRVWDSMTGDVQLDLPVGNTRTGGVAFSPDGSRILVGLLEAGAVLVIDAQTGETLLTLSGHTAAVPGVAYSADGALIVTGSLDEDATVRVWDAATGQQRLAVSLTSGAPRVAFSPDGKYVAAQTNDGTTRIYIVDLDALIAVARSRLTRTWTAAECRRYLHAATCPPPQRPAEPEGGS